MFTSTSCDFGVEGALERFGQCRPKVLLAAAGYQYNGKHFDQRDKIAHLAREIPSLEAVILTDTPSAAGVDKAITWEELPRGEELSFERVAFADPAYILYSSGTTGRPKAIVHSVGGTLLQHLKELSLHCDLTREKNICYFTTCGWMMWNWLVSSLHFGAKVTLYEGSPSHPSLEDFFGVIAREQINIFGTSPKFLRALQDSGYDNDLKLDSLATILTTGAPLLPEQFDFVYQKIKSDLCLSSICGGTDIIGCFMLGNPALPVRRGEIQCLGLGMDVACFNAEGEELVNQEGELVCRKTFPSRPVRFLGDPDGAKIRRAYFERYPGVWHHGDFIHITNQGGVCVHGRSDATLNPSGVRIGTAEIYRQTEKIDFLADSLCVGLQATDDVVIVLFVKMIDGKELTSERIERIKRTIPEGTSPRHVPRHIRAVSDIPYTRSGKKMELPVSRLLAGRTPENIEAVANADCLEEYRQIRAELVSV